VQARLDRNPAKMRERRQTVEHPFGTIKSWMGATHFQMKTFKNVGTEMALHVLAYNIERVMRILGVGGLIERSEHEIRFADPAPPPTKTAFLHSLDP
jgi:Transposase DDE domain